MVCLRRIFRNSRFVFRMRYIFFAMLSLQFRCWCCPHCPMILSTKIFMMRDNWLHSIQFPSLLCYVFCSFGTQSIRLHFDTELVFLLSAVNHQMDLIPMLHIVIPYKKNVTEFQFHANQCRPITIRTSVYELALILPSGELKGRFFCDVSFEISFFSSCFFLE